MKDLNKIFKTLENQFDVEEPSLDHFSRFERKLNAQNEPKKKAPIKIYSLIGIAASIVLFFGIWIGSNITNNGIELAEVSPELNETENYFVSVIQKELETIETERSPETEKLINDAFLQLEKLENQYSSLTIELKQNSNDKRIIYAMISNFQQRIDVLQNLVAQINSVKQLKAQKNEIYA